MVSATGKLGLTATATLVMAAAVIALLFFPLVASTTNSNTLLQFKQALAQVREEAEQGTINNSTTITNDTTSTPQQQAFLPYENPAAGVFMQYPSNWTASISGLRDYTELIAFYSPLENLSQPLGTRLSVSLVKYAENVSLPEYTDFVLAGLQNQTQVEVKNSSDITVAGYPAHRLVLAGTTPLQNNLFTLYQMNTWITIGNKVYIVTYEGEESTFNRHLPEVTHMLESLAIT
jgi:hypothetical protein